MNEKLNRGKLGVFCNHIDASIFCYSEDNASFVLNGSYQGEIMNANQEKKEEKCTCGRRIATEKEHPEAHNAKKCAFCYDFELYVKTINKPATKVS